MNAVTRFFPPGLAIRIYALLLLIIAVTLLWGGGRLLLLGGSPYYVLAGLALGVSSVFLFRGRREGLWLYSALAVATLAWAIWEAGFDLWSLMPRVVFWLVLGLVLVLPCFRRGLRTGEWQLAKGSGLLSWRGLFLAVIAAIAIGSLTHQLRPERLDPRFQTGMASFPDTRAQPAMDDPQAGEWRVWGKDGASTRFSRLDQITPENVHQLEQVWTASVAISAEAESAGVTATPLMIDGTLYTCNGKNELFAIDAESGLRLWEADPAGDRGFTCRGVAFHESDNISGHCAKRIITATGAATLDAYDSETGNRCEDFGEAGVVNLMEGISDAPPAYYMVTSAPAIVRGNVVIGGWVTDNQFWGEPSGVIRAYDAVTGNLAWAWDMGVPDRIGAPEPGETYTPSTPNSWAPISFDEELGLVYLPLGNPTPDYFGAQRRSFDEEYGSSIVALDAQTGRLRWHFQTTHHDLWDYDVATAPVLVDLPQAEGEPTRALVQTTKRGEIFILDAATGEPLRKVEERPVPQTGGVPEDWLSPTQPYSPELPSFRGPRMQEVDMWGITPLDQLYCRITFRESRYDGHFTPPGTDYWITLPGTVGGMNWGSVSVDPVHRVMVTLSGRIAYRSRLIPREEVIESGVEPITDGRLLDGGGAQKGTPYGVEVGYFLSPLFAPCQAPPYGLISAIDLVTGKLIWSRPIGSARDSGPLGVAARLPLPLGTFTMGGPMITGSGLVFTAATDDRTIRALDIRTGKELWQASLPHGGFSIPMTYISPDSGRQFIVLSTGSRYGFGKPDGARLVAFALRNDIDR